MQGGSLSFARGASLRSLPRVSRNVAIAAGVLVLHVAGLWALQSGLLRRAVEIVVPVQIVSELITPPSPPRIEPPPLPPPPAPVVIPPPRPQPKLAPQPVPRQAVPVAPTAPRPLAIPDTTPAPQALVGVAEPQPAPPPITAPVAVTTAPIPPPPAPAAPARLELPISDADYLQNPEPPYPAMSLRMGEEGETIVRVRIGPDGRPREAQVARSSGYPRLDQASVAATMGWRYVPGKRGGVPEEMWVNVPLRWKPKR